MEALRAGMAPTNDGETLYAQRHKPFLTGLSLGFSILSTLASGFAFYWFVRMRRSFRHDLIMLLILSGLVKSLCFVIFPIVGYTRGPIRSDSAFCQVNGFFVAVGFEASDIAVVLIALHSAMYIIRPKFGLYPYRRIAYAAFFTLPIVVASLAFVYRDGTNNMNGSHDAYTNLGYYCYLGNSRSLAVSWIPRHVAFAFIILTYVCIYFSVRRRILQYERRDSVVFRQKVPTKRPIALARRNSYSAGQSSRSSWGGFRGRFWSAPSVARIFSGSGGSTEHRPLNPIEFAQAGEPITWKLPGFAEGGSKTDAGRVGLDERDPFSAISPLNLTTASPFELPAVSPLSPPPPAAHHRPRRGSTTAIPSYRSSATMIPPSTPNSYLAQPSNNLTTMADPFFVDQQHKDRVTGTPIAVPTPPRPSATRFQSSEQATATLSQSRDKIRRQLLSLFIYPLTYVIVWMFPLVQHALGYDTEDSDRDGPAWLIGLSLFSLSIQGLVDCLVFAWREKPWRHTGGVGFWDSLWNVFGWGNDRVGLSKDERLVEAGLAKARRDGEMADEMGTRGAVKRIIRKSRQWWDVDELEEDAIGDDIEAAFRQGSRAYSHRPPLNRKATV